MSRDGNCRAGDDALEVIDPEIKRAPRGALSRFRESEHPDPFADLLSRATQHGAEFAHAGIAPFSLDAINPCFRRRDRLAPFGRARPTVAAVDHVDFLLSQDLHISLSRLPRAARRERVGITRSGKVTREREVWIFLG
jgi:hypothetical protein